jgi:hypothetical protein
MESAIVMRLSKRLFAGFFAVDFAPVWKLIFMNFNVQLGDG